MSTALIVVGNLTKQPELRCTPAGKKVTNFSIAENKKWTNPTTRQEETKVSFYDITAWDSLAENICDSLYTGDRVIVYGRLDMDSWTDRTGNSRTKVKIVAYDVGPALRWATADIEKNTNNHTNTTPE